MARRIQLEVDGVSAIAELCEDLSPNTTEAFWQTLPIETTLAPAKWSGSACYFRPGGDHLKTMTTNEAPVASIYPGYLVTRPGGSEALIAYGASEYRWAVGTDYTTRVARLVDRTSDLLKVLARTHDEGDKTIKITRAE
ncbi:MAG: DUF3830 family protein [Chloroflexi bacterium]|nr:DUF3830 family protein [Chloroflexota bacterium]